MSIYFNPEQAEIVDKAIRAGLIHGPEDVIPVGIGALQERLEAGLHHQNEIGTDVWASQLHAWIYSHSTATSPLPDEAVERQSIYGTRET